MWPGFLITVLALSAIAIVVVASLNRSLPRVARTISWLTIAATAVWLIAAANTYLFGEKVALSLRVRGPEVQLPEGVVSTNHSASFDAATFDRVSLEATGLSFTTRGVYLLATLAGAVALIGACVVINRLARNLGEGDPFILGGVALQRLAWIVLIGGVAATWLTRTGEYLAATELFGPAGWRNSGNDEILSELTALGWPYPDGLSLEIPLWPIGAGLVLALLAAAFRHGANLRRETEGLV